MAEAQALPANVIEMINARATGQYAEWKSTATPEQKAEGLRKLAEFQNNEEAKNRKMAQITQCFTDADADGNGALNLEEYRTFEASTRKIAIDDGDWREADPKIEETYALMNAVSEGEGFTMADMFATMGPWMAKF